MIAPGASAAGATPPADRDFMISAPTEEGNRFVVPLKADGTLTEPREDGPEGA